MSQYTDKINAIAEDFASIEYYEKVSSLQARDGIMIVHYNHGGSTMEFRIDSKYEEFEGKAGETITTPPHDEEYIRLMAKYQNQTWGSKLGKWWKNFSKKEYTPKT